MSGDKAVVKVGVGFTVNLGQYESARIDAGVEIQGEKSQISELWKEAENEVVQQIEHQIRSLKEQVDERTTLLGMPKGASFK